jgi:hypothetical protein
MTITPKNVVTQDDILCLFNQRMLENAVSKEQGWEPNQNKRREDADD